MFNVLLLYVPKSRTKDLTDKVFKMNTRRLANATFGKQDINDFSKSFNLTY